MDHNETKAPIPPEAQEIACQAEVELAILLTIEQSLRIALQWMTRGRGNSHKLSTLRFQASAFGRQLTRMKVLADHGGYMHLITDAHPHWSRKVEALKTVRANLHADLEGLILRLDRVSGDDAGEFEQICADLLRLLDELKTHSQEERELLQRSFIHEEGGES